MPGDEVVIVPYRDGPYLVRGPVTLRDQDGQTIDAGRATVALCRCGRSRLRPFCDGSHHLIRFRAPSAREARADGGARPAAGVPVEHDAAASPLPSVIRDLARAQRDLARLPGEDAATAGGERLAEAARLLAAASELLQGIASSEEPPVRGRP